MHSVHLPLFIQSGQSTLSAFYNLSLYWRESAVFGQWFLRMFPCTQLKATTIVPWPIKHSNLSVISLKKPTKKGTRAECVCTRLFVSVPFLKSVYCSTFMNLFIQNYHQNHFDKQHKGYMNMLWCINGSEGEREGDKVKINHKKLKAI